MVVVLCEEWDLAGLWAAGRLRARGLNVEIVTGADLAAAERWEHRVDEAGGATLDLTFADGRRFDSRTVRGALNRLSFIPSAWMQRVGGPDRDYAVQEMYAFYLSWLYCLPGPILNPPTPQGLCGNWRHPSAWALLAARAGLPVGRYSQSDEDDPAALWNEAAAPPAPSAAVATVVDRRVVATAAVPQRHHEPCRRLARAAGVTLLEIDFAARADGELEFRGASVMPDLVRGGEPLVDALAEVFA